MKTVNLRDNYNEGKKFDIKKFNMKEGCYNFKWGFDRLFMFLFVFIFLLLIFLPITSATLTVGNSSHSIEKKYGLEQNIIGWINVSVANEDINSVFRDSEGRIISLINLLRLNPNALYSCNPLNCQKDYSVGSELTESINGVNFKKVLGMQFTGDIIAINSIDFDFGATEMLSASCTNQLEIDFFNDGIIDFSNNLSDSSICQGTKTYGCYNPGTPSEEVIIETNPLCQKINLTKAPGFRFGVWVKKVTAGNKNLSLSLYDSSGYEIPGANCLLPMSLVSEGEVFCDVSYSVSSTKESYLCLKVKNGNTGEYRTKGYETDSGCGFNGYPPGDERTAYHLSVEAKKYAQIGLINFRNNFYENVDAALATEQYIQEKYGGMDCGTAGCVVPIAFIVNQTETTPAKNISVKNVEIEYRRNSGLIPSNKIYSLSEKNATINFGFTKLEIGNSGFKAKNATSKNYTYELTFGGKKIFTEKISSQKGPFIKGLSPLSTAYAFPTTFQVSVDVPGNVSRYDWNFGDNETATTTANKATHVYDGEGTYNLSVSIKDFSNITSSRTFQITVTSPKTLINTTIAKMKTNVANIKKQIDSYELFYRASLNSIINTNNLSMEIKILEDRYKNFTGTDYTPLVYDMLNIKIPESVARTTTANSLLYFPKEQSINVGVLESIEKKEYRESDSAYRDAIFAWNAENMNSRLTFEEISAQYPGISQPILRVFKFTVSEKTALNYNSYFIVKDMTDLKFERDYGETSVGGYNYIEITGGTKEIIFSTTEDVDFETVPAFISPDLSRLSIIDSGEIPLEEIPDFKLGIFALVIILLLVIAVVVYIILQIWYKRKYEDHLFKNKNDLLNLFHYIESQRKKGIHESEINNKLKNSGWNGEQIRYAMRKHSGLGTGMLEIPIEKLFKNMDEKNHGNQPGHGHIPGRKPY
ncbi:MAG: PKD domain-containing protein [Candidatus Pacearchaeota archaeon]